MTHTEDKWNSEPQSKDAATDSLHLVHRKIKYHDISDRISWYCDDFSFFICGKLWSGRWAIIRFKWNSFPLPCKSWLRPPPLLPQHVTNISSKGRSLYFSVWGFHVSQKTVDSCSEFPADCLCFKRKMKPVVSWRSFTKKQACFLLSAFLRDIFSFIRRAMKGFHQPEAFLYSQLPPIRFSVRKATAGRLLRRIKTDKTDTASFCIRSSHCDWLDDKKAVDITGCFLFFKQQQQKKQQQCFLSVFFRATTLFFKFTPPVSNIYSEHMRSVERLNVTSHRIPC